MWICTWLDWASDVFRLALATSEELLLKFSGLLQISFRMVGSYDGGRRAMGIGHCYTPLLCRGFSVWGEGGEMFISTLLGERGAELPRC